MPRYFPRMFLVFVFPTKLKSFEKETQKFNFKAAARAEFWCCHIAVYFAAAAS
jgi:hypothetical protein